MDGQLYLTWLAVGLAGLYVLMRGWRALKGGCGGGCGCSKAAKPAQQQALIAPEQLTLRNRRG